jgi:hypothetical protein
MPSRFLASAIAPAIVLPALALSHPPVQPGFGISRAVHLVTSAISSVASSPSLSAAERAARTGRHPGAAVKYVVLDCQSDPVVRPQTFLLACADGGDRLSKLRWTSWGPGYATASGIQTIKDTQGSYHAYAIRVILWGSAPLAGHPGERRYQMITLLYTSHEAQQAGPPSVTGNLWD